MKRCSIDDLKYFKHEFEQAEEDMQNALIAYCKEELKYVNSINLRNPVLVDCWNKGYMFKVMDIIQRKSDGSIMIHGQYCGEPNKYEFLSYVDGKGIAKIIESINI